MVAIIVFAGVAGVIGALGASLLLERGVRGRVVALYLAGVVLGVALIVPIVITRRFTLWWFAFAVGSGVLTYLLCWVSRPQFGRIWRQGKRHAPW